mgnify:CR=1 FL=1
MSDKNTKINEGTKNIAGTEKSQIADEPGVSLRKPDAFNGPHFRKLNKQHGTTHMQGDPCQESITKYENCIRENYQYPQRCIELAHNLHECKNKYKLYYEDRFKNSKF